MRGFGCPVLIGCVNAQCTAVSKRRVLWGMRGARMVFVHVFVHVSAGNVSPVAHL